MNILYLIISNTTWVIVSAPDSTKALDKAGLTPAECHLLDSPAAQRVLNNITLGRTFGGYLVYEEPAYTLRELESGDWQVLDANGSHTARTTSKMVADLILAALLAYKP